MKRKTTLGALLAVAAAPAVVAPQLIAPALAQGGTLTTPGEPTGDRAEYPDVPQNHWAYQAIDRLSRAGIIEGYPDGGYKGPRAMTRYEFAVAIARILDKFPPPAEAAAGYNDKELRDRIVVLEGRPGPDITKAEVNDLIAALRREFADELARLGVRVDALETRVSNLENRVAAPPRVTITPSLLHRTGFASYISNTAVPRVIPGLPSSAAIPATRGIVNGNLTAAAFPAGVIPAATPPYFFFRPRGSTRSSLVNAKYSYTDFELRLTDRVTDRLSVTGALRALGDSAEDPWTGNTGSVFYLREGFAHADLGQRSFLGAKGLTLNLGRQRTKIGQGLLYDNDLQPTDQIQAQFNIGPLQLTGFVGTTNNMTAFGGNPYNVSGAVANLGLSGQLPGLPNGPGFFAIAPGAIVPTTRDVFFGLRTPANFNARTSGAAVGFPTAAVGMTDDNESALRIGFNLFRISGNPVSIGLTRQFDGVENQQGDSIDLTVPLFNRTIGVEYVRQRRYYNGNRANGNPKAYNITVPLLRARVVDLNFAFGKADDDFEYFASSAANPYARTYAEALFDRPLALGAPMINGRLGGRGVMPLYVAAKEAYDFNGTLRIIRRLPLDFRYYKAYGSRLQPGGRRNALDLGSVWSVGSTFNVSPGLDLELKYGRYNVPGPLNSVPGFTHPDISYFRVGANVGF